MTKIVVRNLEGQAEHDATGCFDIVVGDGAEKVRILVRETGWIEVFAVDRDLEVRPGASNALRLRAAPAT